VALFDRSFRDFGIRAIAWPDAPKTCTHQIYFASLARHFRSDNSAFVRVRSPYLKVCSRRSAELRHRIAPPGKLVCGLSWISKNDAIGARKSLSLNSLLPLLQLPDTVFINLQYGNTQEEQAHLKEDQGLELINIQEIDNFNDLDGLAALIEACDVVVTVSNTTAHLAGALGKPVYLILPNGSGLLWYWHLKRSDNPWYPSMHIYRGKSSGDHAEWLQCLRNDLAKLHNPGT